LGGMEEKPWVVCKNEKKRKTRKRGGFMKSPIIVVQGNLVCLVQRVGKKFVESHQF